MSLFCNMGLYFIPRFAIIVLRKIDRDMVFFLSNVLLLACSCQCSAALPTVPWVGLWSLIMAFSDHSHLYFYPIHRRNQTLVL